MLIINDILINDFKVIAEPNLKLTKIKKTIDWIHRTSQQWPRVQDTTECQEPKKTNFYCRKMSKKFEVTAKPNVNFRHVKKQTLISYIQYHNKDFGDEFTIQPNAKNPILYRMWWELCNRKFGYNIIPQSELDKDANLTGWFCFKFLKLLRLLIGITFVVQNLTK